MVFDAVNNAQCNAAQSLNQRSVVSLNLLLSLSILLIVQFMLTFRQSFLNFDPPATTDSSSSSLTPLHNNPIIASLMELTQSNRKVISCPSTLMLVNDSLLDPATSSFALRRKIPRIVHVSSGSRCNDQIIAENLDTWRLQGHFFFLHDDDAVLKLLHQDWPEFPLLRQIMTCIPGRMGAAWIDLWRLLVLWKYGGIYADLDTSPVPSLFNETTISEEDDAFFVVDQSAAPSQWFMATSPKHPLIYLSIFQLMMNVMKEMDLGNFQVVFTTGPGALMQGFVSFMRNDSLYWKVPAGHYVGVGLNRTVTLVGNRTNENMYITRVIEPLLYNHVKHQIYQKSNMSHLTEEAGTIYKPQQSVESCLSRLFFRMATPTERNLK